MCLFLQLIEEVQVKQPEVELVLERADQLYKDCPPGQADKVRKSNTMSVICLLKGTNCFLVAYFSYAANCMLWKHLISTFYILIC